MEKKQKPTYAPHVMIGPHVVPYSSFDFAKQHDAHYRQWLGEVWLYTQGKRARHPAFGR